MLTSLVILGIILVVGLQYNLTQEDLTMKNHIITAAIITALVIMFGTAMTRGILFCMELAFWTWLFSSIIVGIIKGINLYLDKRDDDDDNNE